MKENEMMVQFEKIVPILREMFLLFIKHKVDDPSILLYTISIFMEDVLEMDWSEKFCPKDFIEEIDEKLEILKCFVLTINQFQELLKLNKDNYEEFIK